MKECLGREDLTAGVYIGLIAYIRYESAKDSKTSMKILFRSGLFPLIIKMSTATSLEQMMVEITWLMTNITSVEDDEDIINEILKPKYKLFEYLEEMMNYKNDKVVEHAIWSLTNLVEENDNERFRLIFQTGIIDILKGQINNEVMALGLTRVIAWATSQLCRCKVRSLDFISAMLEILSTLLFVMDNDAQVDTCYGIKHLTDIVEEGDEELEKEKGNLIASLNIIKKLVDLIEYNKGTFCPALRAIGNICSLENKS